MATNMIAKISVGIKRDNMPLLDLPFDDSQCNGSRTSSSTVQFEQPPLITTSNGTCSHDNGTHLRAKLRFFLMSPCWKWHLKRQCPWKAWFQFIKIIILTTQLILFGIERQSHVVFISESNITFHHLFIRGWSSADETLPYPRASGDFAVYTNQDFIDSINYAVHRFNNLTNISLGLFDYHEHATQKSYSSDSESRERYINLCLDRFKTCRIDPTSHTYILDSETENNCSTLNATNNFKIEEYLLNVHNETVNYCGLNSLTLEFAIHAIQLKNQKLFSLPDCYHFSVKITFDNNARTGKIRQHLNSQAQFRTCNRKLIHQYSDFTLTRRNLLIVLDCVVLLITIISFILCIRSLWFGHRLCREVCLYYSIERTSEKPLTWSELQIFYSYWYFLMIITDLMVIPGTIIKIGILFKVTDDYNAAGLLLGLSSLLSWIGILRYLSFFRKYNLLFVTISTSLPLILRFLLCALIIYCGYMFCGWIVLGPYHTKFRTISTTFETLFGLINGDDMYSTYANLETESIYIWVFSEIYLYSFICLFIYVVSSLVIALIIDGYDTVKRYYIDGFPKSRLQQFSEENAPQWSGLNNWQDLTTAIGARSVCFPCCSKTPQNLTDMITADAHLMQNVNTFS
ncbi:unnamed protein product [Rotaria sordida]|uniref:Mucolipin-3 n=2 Tax=Rotaria sordida TaxID=392033 RepID=A0A814RWT3_9BILA|nr:unnamed protein product [Rotaria sordida]CAF1017092.1 unnamed protein product [Rotaria sordida]CAF1139568.1 unnamed protein product [Rotaria sordida]